MRACAVLVAALQKGAPRLASRERRHLAALIDHLHAPWRPTSAVASEREISRRLTSFVRRDPTCRELVTDRLRHAARHLASDGMPPHRGAGEIAWRAVVLAAARLHDSRVRRLPRGCFDPRLLEALTREGCALRPRTRATRTQYAVPGPVLQQLSIGRGLQRAASRAIGYRLVPARTAVYMYDPPGSRVPPHLDAAPYEVIVHIVLEHVGANGDPGSALVVYGRKEVRLPLRPGEGVVLAGRGAVHQWEPLGASERRMLVGIGFTPAARANACS